MTNNGIQIGGSFIPHVGGDPYLDVGNHNEIWIRDAVAPRDPSLVYGGDKIPGQTRRVEKYRDSGVATANYVSRFWDTRNGSNLSYNSASASTHRSFEYAVGYNHPGWRLRNLLPVGWDLGGPFTKYDVVINGMGADVNAYYTVGGYARNEFNGLLFASQETANLAAHPKSTIGSDLNWIRGVCPTLPSASFLEQLGATAVSMVAPTAPAADMSVAIGELIHDGLPSIPGTGRQAGNVGSEYLNMQFAWSPTIQDGLSFIKAIRNQDVTLQQYVRDSGRLVRRRHAFPTERSVTTTVQGNKVPANLGLSPDGQQISLGTLTETRRVTKKTWFSGAFMYHLPEGILGRTVAELDRSYGVVPGDTTLWNLTPWSWLADWFSNAGNVMQNIDAFLQNSLIMPYGYICTDITEEYQADWSGSVNRNGWSPLALSDWVVKHSYIRQQANPFGFGVTWDGLSPFQLSILAALGISRGQGQHQ